MDESTVSKFDRAFGGLAGGNGIHTKTTTIENMEPVTGEAETFVVQTFRDERGDHVVIKFIDKGGVVRLILPPRVANSIASQRDSLTSKRRSINGKQAAKDRMERGELPGFMKKRA